MATPGRQRPLRAAGPAGTAEHAALRAKIATMTYSFAQQMPQLPSRPSSGSRAPIPRPGPSPLTTSTSPVDSTSATTSTTATISTTMSDDPNFPLLTPVQQNHSANSSIYIQPADRSSPTSLSTSLNSPRAWETATSKASSSSPSAQRAPRWTNAPGKIATAAEVVASMPSDQAAQEADHSESAKHQAELALYSKLVPTTSAVPRNPGRSLGGGGLRATGSVAAQKTVRSVSTTTALQAPQSLPVVPRKEPLASRMRSLSSEASKPQLARRVAKPNRTPSATPPPALEPDFPRVSTADTTTEEKSETDAVVVPTPQALGEARAESSDPYLKNIVAVYGKVEKDLSRQSTRNEASNNAVRRTSGDGPIPIRARNQLPASRRLDEAFSSGGRFDGGRSLSPVAARRNQIGALRRSSAPSPPLGAPATRRTGGRDDVGLSLKNGTKSTAFETSSDVPPGFEGRTATMSKAGYTSSNKSDADGARRAKSGDRDGVRARPQNARADAFREAINDTRRHSSSPRPASFRRAAQGDSHADSRNGSKGGASASRTASGREGSRRQDADKAIVRPTSFPSTRSSAVGVASGQGSHRSRGVSSNFSPKSKRGDRGIGRSMEKPTESVTDQRSPGSRNGLTSQELSREANGVDSTFGVIDYELPVEKNITYLEGEGPLNAPVAVKHGYAFPEITSESIGGVQVSNMETNDEVVPNKNYDSKPSFQCRRVNGWCEETNEVGGGAAEAIVNDLLSHEDDDFVPPLSVPMAHQLPSAYSRLSMIDVMRQLHASGTVSPVLSSAEKPEDILLPPLPNSEDVRFESMLRSMGWTPPEEDETPKSQRSNGVTLPMRQGPSRVVRVAASDMGLQTGLRNGENEKAQSPYYSHFQ